MFPVVVHVYGFLRALACCMFVKWKVNETGRLGNSCSVSIPTTSLQFIALGERSDNRPVIRVEKKKTSSNALQSFCFFPSFPLFFCFLEENTFPSHCRTPTPTSNVSATTPTTSNFASRDYFQCVINTMNKKCFCFEVGCCSSQRNQSDSFFLVPILPTTPIYSVFNTHVAVCAIPVLATCRYTCRLIWNYGLTAFYV